jgi:hypothetical protein
MRRAINRVLDFGFDKEARSALGRVIEQWLNHLLGLETRVRAVPEIHDKNWVWFVGLDQEATNLGNMMWNGKDLPEVDRARVVALYEMTFVDTARVSPKVGKQPVYLLLAMGADRIVRIKPQNLIAGLPLVETN